MSSCAIKNSQVSVLTFFNSAKKDKYLIISENVLLIQKKLVILHSVWNKYQKIKQKT